MESVADFLRGFFSGGPFQNLVLLVGIGFGLYVLFRRKDRDGGPPADGGGE